jgi:hypothetical protein
MSVVLSGDTEALLHQTIRLISIAVWTFAILICWCLFALTILLQTFVIDARKLFTILWWSRLVESTSFTLHFAVS